ncbi:hypothetical protein V3C99_012607 [Haemonchus contortus]
MPNPIPTTHWEVAFQQTTIQHVSMNNSKHPSSQDICKFYAERVASDASERWELKNLGAISYVEAEERGSWGISSIATVSAPQQESIGYKMDATFGEN